MMASSNFIGMSIGPLLGGITADLLGYRISFFIGSLSLALGFFLVLFSVKEEKMHKSQKDDLNTETERSSSPVHMISLTIVGALLLLFILRLSRILPLAFIPIHVQNIMGSIEGASSITGMISFGRGAVTALASVTIVRLGDRYQKMKLAAVLLGISTLTSLPILISSDLFNFSVFFILGTFFLGGVEPLLQSEIVSSVPVHRQGFVFGIQTTVGNMGWFLAPLTGSLISIHMGIPAVFLFMILFLAAATGISVFITSMLNKQPVPEKQEVLQD